jgi:hypothetical protein
MWMFAAFGVLMPAARPAKYTPKGDPRTMQIRSRRAQDLDILRALHMQGTLGRTIHTPDKDYEYRAYCKPEDFAWAVFDMILKIDYTKFKPETDNFADEEHHSFLMSVWSTYLRMISSKKHQDEYWRGQEHWSGTDYYNRSRNATYPHKNAGSKYTVPALPSGHKVEVESVELPPLAGDSRYSGLGYPEHRGSAADRDEYVPEVWVDPKPAVGSGDVMDEVDAVLDAHYESAAEALGYGDYANKSADDTAYTAYPDDAHDVEATEAETQLGHAGCDHGYGEAAKRRCIRRRRRAGTQATF